MEFGANAMLKSESDAIGGMFMKPARWIGRIKSSAKVIEKDIVEDERKKNFEISRIDRFRYRTRYFTDSGIIGTKEFVSTNYQKFKDLFMSKNEKIPKAGFRIERCVFVEAAV